MKVGDLVKYNDPRYPEWSSLIGIIVRQIAGTAEYQPRTMPTQHELLRK